jgi:hypothetical protein
MPCLILYCGYKGLTSGLDDHNYAEGTYFLFIGYLLFVILREAQREARVKHRKATNETQVKPSEP